MIHKFPFHRVLALLVLSLLAASAWPALPPTAVAAEDPLRELSRPNGSNFVSWHSKDKELVNQLYRTIQSGGNPAPALFRQWQALSALMHGTVQGAAYVDEDTGLTIYTAQATGVLQALGLALKAREDIIARILRSQLAGAPLQASSMEIVYPPLGRGGPGMLFPTDGLQVPAGTYLNPQTVINTIKDLMKNGVPMHSFSGAKVYIAPFSFADAPGGGFVKDTPGVNAFQAILSSTRAQNHPVGTIGHLYGQYMLAKYFGLTPKVNEENWKRYLSLRGSSPDSPREWVDEGDWEALTVNNWAEDFRVSFGTNQANYAHRGNYRHPKAAIMNSFRELVKSAATYDTKLLAYDHVQVSDGKHVSYATGGAHTHSMVTTSRSISVTGNIAMSTGTRPKVTIYGRRNPRDRWVPIAGGRTNQLGQFNIPLTIGPGVWELAVDAVSDGLRAEETFTVIVITRQVAGEYWEIPDFNDLDGHWSQAQVYRLVELGAVSGMGDGTFRPGEPISRGAFLKVMMSALRAEALVPERFVLMDIPLYEDIGEHWSRSFVEDAYANSFFNSTEYFPRFDPDQPITREEIGRLAGAAIESAVFDFGETRELRQFSDADAIEAWRTPAIATAVRHGVLTGYPDGTFQPKLTATRAEAAVIVIRLLEKVKELKAEKA